MVISIVVSLPLVTMGWAGFGLFSACAGVDGWRNLLLSVVGTWGRTRLDFPVDVLESPLRFAALEAFAV